MGRGDHATEDALPGEGAAVPRVGGVPRRALLRQLDRVTTTGLGLVVAPRGAGKTTIMAQWAATLDVPVAWFRLEAGDGGPGVLVGRLWDRLTSGGRDHVPVTVEHLVRRLRARGEPLLLAFDDVHELNGTPGAVDLEQLLLRSPGGVAMLLGSRRMPSLDLTRSELPTPVLITAADLRFRTWEVDRLFREGYDAPLPPEDIAQLTAHTEGWVAALHLFHRSTQGMLPGDRRRAVRNLHGRSRYAWEYLSSQVLAGVPPDLALLLRRTSVFEVLTSDRCEALLGTGRAQRDLAELQRLVTLVSSDDGVTYRCHRVLRRHLETGLTEELGAEGARAWHERAAEVLEAEGAVTEALRARCRGKDWAGVTRILRECGPRLADVEGEDWTDLLPDEIVRTDPWSSLARARRLAADGRLTQAQAAVEQAKVLATGPAALSRYEEVRRAVGLWAGGQPSRRPTWMEILRTATRRDPLEGAHTARRIAGAHGLLLEGLCLLLAGNQRGARAALRRAAEDPDGDRGTALAAELAGAAVASAVAHLPASLDVVDRVQVEAERHGLPWLARLAHGVLVGHDGGQHAHAEAEAVAAYCDRIGDRWGAALIRGATAIAAMRTGAFDPQEWEEVALRMRELDAGTLEAWARSCHALAIAARQLPDAADEAGSAESFARSAAVPGALAIAYAALAATRPTERSDFLHLADSTADAEGLDSRPWRWLPRAPAAVAAARVTAPEPEAELDVRCFGEFRIAVRGHEVDLMRIRPRARAALRFLALHAGRPVHREQLAAALWGDLGEAAAMHNLQVSISVVRRTLEPGLPARSSRLIVRDGEAYTLRLRIGSGCDLVDFEEALKEASRHRAARDPDGTASALRRALELYRGDLLPEDGPAEWVVGARERYRSQAAEAATSLAALELGRGDLVAAIRAANRSIELDDYRDASWRLLVEALTRSGDAAEAARASHSYRKMLSTLGVSSTTPLARGTPLPPPRRASR